MTDARICIVTPDIIGPIDNGGIGTHVHHLALRLVKAGEAVDVLFTGPFERGDEKQWKQYYNKYGVRLITLGDLPLLSSPIRLDRDLRYSWMAYHYLRTQNYKCIHFQEWLATGFFTIKAKRTRGEFSDCRLTVTLHSSTQWIAEGSLRWYSNPISDSKVAWAERYTAKYADSVISPSQHMFEWAKNAGWKLASDQRILPYCLEPDAVMQSPAQPENGVIAFFGRLETRKGLEPFLIALTSLPRKDLARVQKLLFVGKNGVAAGISAEKYIHTELQNSGIKFDIHTDLDSAQAQALLKEERAVAFVPSLLDNFPFTVLECCSKGIPLMAANTGGIPEILDETALFAPTPNGIKNAIQRALNNKVEFGAYSYNPDRAFDDWLTLTRQNIAPRQTTLVSSTHTNSDEITSEQEEAPLISVCVPFYNYGRYIRQMLDSLERQTFKNFEVNVIDDGSTDPASSAMFDTLKTDYPEPRYKFFRQENAGVGAARNAAANKAKGRYLVFMDADNIAMPNMLETFVQAMERTGDDVLTCHFNVFNLETEPPQDYRADFIYAPLGPCLEASWYDNVLGDANLIVKRSAFEAIGGFTTDRDSSWEDWEFLLNLILQGFSHDVIPMSLFWYRNQDEGFSRNTNLYRNQKRVLRPFLQAVDPKLQPVIRAMFEAGLSQPESIKGTLLQAARLWSRRHPGLSSKLKRLKIVQKYIRG